MKLPFVVQRLWDQYSRPNSKLDRYRVSFKSSGMSSPLGRVSLMKEEDAEQFKKKKQIIPPGYSSFSFYYIQDVNLLLCC